jgi:hypothetical protein
LLRLSKTSKVSDTALFWSKKVTRDTRNSGFGNDKARVSNMKYNCKVSPPISLKEANFDEDSLDMKNPAATTAHPSPELSRGSTVLDDTVLNAVIIQNDIVQDDNEILQDGNDIVQDDNGIIPDDPDLSTICPATNFSKPLPESSYERKISISTIITVTQLSLVFCLCNTIYTVFVIWMVDTTKNRGGEARRSNAAPMIVMTDRLLFYITSTFVPFLNSIFNPLIIICRSNNIKQSVMRSVNSFF